LTLTHPNPALKHHLSDNGNVLRKNETLLIENFDKNSTKIDIFFEKY